MLFFVMLVGISSRNVLSATSRNSHSNISLKDALPSMITSMEYSRLVPHKIISGKTNKTGQYKHPLSVNVSSYSNGRHETSKKHSQNLLPLYSEINQSSAHHKNANVARIQSYQEEHLVTPSFNNNNSDYHYLYRNQQVKKLNLQSVSVPPTHIYNNRPTTAGQIPRSYQDNWKNYSDTYSKGSLFFQPQAQQYYQNVHKKDEEGEDSWENFEIEDKVFSKTVTATKALKTGKIVFTFFMVLIVLIIAGLGKLGLTVSPVVLPLALFPVGVIALLLFIPLFLLSVPLAATGVIGDRKMRRRRRRHVNPFEASKVPVMEVKVQKILDTIDVPRYGESRAAT